MKYKMTNFYIVNEEESVARCTCGLTFLDKRIEEGFHNIKCPNCGNMDHAKMNVARRTCGYIGTNFFNQGRTDEIRNRYVHLDNHKID